VGSLAQTIMPKKFGQLANYIAEASGDPGVLAVALLTVLLWLVTGPFFAYSVTWQLVMNTWTSVVTFIMVFLVQTSQNRHSAALQGKLDELIRASEAHNSFVGIERLPSEEIQKVRQGAHGHLGENVKG
jgi:low affinity Fe/Cu permease